MKTRTVLVTGGNRGIGKAIVEGLSKMSGLTVLLGCRDIEQGKSIAEGIDGDVRAVALDVSSRETLQAQVAEILQEFPVIDVLINNAGILREGKVLEAEDAGFDDTLRVNVTGPFDLIRLLAPGMIQNGYGRIVNVSSGWGSFNEGLGGPTAYSVSKAALNALTFSAAGSLPDCIKINAMCPGWVRTDMGGSDAERSPEEGADTALWLATLPDDGPTGGFFRDRQPIQW
jgi:NAD(P)-dependent dehydrogenase (short-subunit alcohol dehydrogenase family)